MARRSSSSPPPPEDFTERIVDVDVQTEMNGSFLEYAYSVIYSRALPDARDGLKPVQRRILYSMSEMGLRPDRGHVKSSRVVGDCMGKYHPHGDTAIYDALVRMAQPFSLRLPLIDGHGNFGSADDGPAAMRYCVTGSTRIRLADGSTRSIADIAREHAVTSEGEASIGLKVLGARGEPVLADKVFHSGEHPVLTFRTRNGFTLTGTSNHPVLVLDGAPDGARPPRLLWKRLDELAVGDHVTALRVPAAESGSPMTARDADLALLFGSWVSEGWYTTRAGFNNTDRLWFEQVEAAYRRVVGEKFYVAQRLLVSGTPVHEIDIHNLSELDASPLVQLKDLRSGDKVIPPWVWAAGPAVKQRFLQALFEGDGSFSVLPRRTIHVAYSTKSAQLASDIQQLLLEFGVVSTVCRDRCRPDAYRAVITNRRDARLFATRIGFLSRKRQPFVDALTALPENSSSLSTDHVPFLAAWIRHTAPRGNRRWLSKRNLDRVERWERDTQIADRLSAEALGVATPLVEGVHHFSTVSEIRPGGVEPVYSLRIATEQHAFITNGLVSHNTEARLAPSALLMTASLDEDTVEFVPNYDDQLVQPAVLPAAFPNLLVNGASGIAVGMATNMAPHNLVEVIAAARHLILHPDATLDDLMRFVPGPDLPTGGRIVGLEGVREAYETGRGSFRTRATARVEAITPRRQGIVVTELPYTVGPEKVIEKIKTLVQAKKLQGVSAVTDLTDRAHGLRLVIEVKNGFNPDAVLEQLYRLTPMEDSFGINNVALVEGQPRTLGLRGLLQVYVDFRVDVVRRRSEHRLARHQNRLHLVEGLLIAILDIDEVIAIIRSSDDAETARTRLEQVFDLSNAQAEYILELRLRRLTKFSRIELETEADELRRQIEELRALLGDDALLRRLVSDELAAVAKAHGTPRRTVLLASAGSPVTAAAPLEVSDGPCWVLLSSTGLLARTADAEPLPPEGPRHAHDTIVAAVRTTVRGDVGMVTSRGRVLRLSVLELPALPPTHDAPGLAGGAPLGAFVDLPAAERVLTLTGLRDGSPGLALGTAQGVVKRVVPDHPSGRDEWEVIGPHDGDEVVGAVELVTESQHLCFITSDAQLLHFPGASVRPQGRAAGGMAGIKLADGASAIWFGALDPQAGDPVVVTVSGSSAALPGTETGSVKVTPFSEYPAKGRATAGVRCHRFVRGEDMLILGWAGPTPARASGGNGSPIELPPATGRRDGSGTPAEAPLAAIASPAGMA